MAAKKKGLGRGLDLLIPEENREEGSCQRGCKGSN